MSTLAKGLQDWRNGFSVASGRKMAIKARKNLHAGVFLLLLKGNKFKRFSGRNDEATTKWQNSKFKSLGNVSKLEFRGIPEFLTISLRETSLKNGTLSTKTPAYSLSEILLREIVNLIRNKRHQERTTELPIAYQQRSLP